MDALIIAGHFSADHEDSLRHTDNYRLNIEGVPASVPHLVAYFREGRRLPDAQRRAQTELSRPFQQIYHSGLHIYNLLTRHGLEAGLLNCHDPSDPSRLSFYAEKPPVVLLSTTFMNMDALRKVAEDVRAHLPDAWIIAGGNYAHHSYLVWKRRDEAHYGHPSVQNSYMFTAEKPIEAIDAYVTAAHGERTLMRMVDSVLQGKRPMDMPNTIVRDGKEWRVNEEEPEDYVMDDHRILWRDVPRRFLASTVPFSLTYGCPYQCAFCNFARVQFTKKSLDVIFAELRDLASHNVVQNVWFTDDNFLLNPRMVEAFAERMIEEDLPFSWVSFIRANSVTSRTAELLKRSKAALLVLGLESGSTQILRNMKKYDTVEGYRSAMDLLIEQEIDTEISFIFGFPGETEHTVGETIEFLNGLPTHPTQTNFLYLFKHSIVPLSGVFEQKMRDKWNLEGYFGDWRHDTMASDEVDGVLQRVAAEVTTTVFNYMDPAGKLSKSELVSIQRLRDNVGRALLKGEAAEPHWGRLEAAIQHHFGNGKSNGNGNGAARQGLNENGRPANPTILRSLKRPVRQT